MRYNGSIRGKLNNSSPTSSSGIWSLNDVQENSTDINWPEGGANTCEYVVVGGGGGGGGATSSNACGGGGGGGGFLEGSFPINISYSFHCI